MVSEQAAMLFDGWDEALIWSCLQGHMGTMLVDDADHPASAIIDIGDFCFCAGRASGELLRSLKGSKLLVPRDSAWQMLIERVHGQKAEKMLRYAIKKEPSVFHQEKLASYVQGLDGGYTLKLFDSEAFQQALSESWSVDLCSQFENFEDYQCRAIGVALLHGGKLVAGASPYAVYNGGIEIEIDTDPAYRGRGLATVCGARLILECLSKGIYPSWDAHDLRSVHLAEKLGYHLSHPYVAYELSDD